MPEEATLIVTTFNWPQALRLTLDSVCRQSVAPALVIVADDGSDEDTARIVRTVLAPSKLKWCHARHEDSGIRQARVKNLGVRYSVSSYLIFIDHDVVLHPDFVADHLLFAEKNVFLQGKRTFLPPYFTNKALNSEVFSPPSPFLPGLKNRKNAFRCPRFGKALARRKPFQTSLRGCNLSMFREDFLEVDGYDETFDGLWGREDSDICYRLFHSDKKCRNLWFSALQYHLHHRVSKRNAPDRLDSELDLNRRQKRREANNGFSTLSTEGELVAESKGFDI